ncbi:DUF5320 domain-containing protein [Maledivibacter halophilus]|uniref:Uncharacterized protein n=1 Tax=Maledivibacter halophilus TaxID=36842 RepID=A0A1T5LZR9_9FIRM|nr:DUF5320 domain-containing protein [Maledivibacter halophilus]SKC81079.1 hypothetical protein SAMN02194393_03540 [Maledivibacter halophilus]
MPRNDGTGPLGQGPMTGRALGNCGDGKTANTSSSIRGSGLGRGLGRGNGRGLGRFLNNEKFKNQK